MRAHDYNQLRSVNLHLQPAGSGWFGKLWLTAVLAMAYPGVNSLYAKCISKSQPAASKTLSDTGRVYSGIIIDSRKESIAGGTVRVVGTKISTGTDTSGRFRIQVPNGKDSLEISFIGYKTQYIDLRNASKMNCQVELTELTGITMQDMIAGGIIVRYPFYKRWYYRFIKRPIKSIFG